MSQEMPLITPTLSIFKAGERQFLTTVDRPIEVGRQRKGEPQPITRSDHPGLSRVIIAEYRNTRVSRSHLLVTPKSDGCVRITNESNVLNFQLQSGTIVEPGASVVVHSVTYLELDCFMICIDSPGWKSIPFVRHTSPAVRLASPDATKSAPVEETVGSLIETLGSSFDSAQGDLLLQWLKAATDVFQIAASSNDFLDHAVRAVLDIIGLDFALIFQYEINSLNLEDESEGQWHERSRRGTTRGDGEPFVREMLSEILAEKRTLIYHPSPNATLDSEDIPFNAAVAAPILNQRGTLVGAVYAARSRTGSDERLFPRISKLQASIVELISRAVATGWARQDNEVSVVRPQAQRLQVYGPWITPLLHGPHLEFSGVSRQTSQLICHVTGLDALVCRPESEQVNQFLKELLFDAKLLLQERLGFVRLVDNGRLIAYWGAPIESENAANAAVEATIALTEHLRAVTVNVSRRSGCSVGFHIALRTEQARMFDLSNGEQVDCVSFGEAGGNAEKLLQVAELLGVEILVCNETIQNLSNSRFTVPLGEVAPGFGAAPLSVSMLVIQPTAESNNWNRHCGDVFNALERRGLQAAIEISRQFLRDCPEEPRAAAQCARLEQMLRNANRRDK